MKILSCLFFIGSYTLFCQQLSFPIKSDISLVGNYAELRKNHFHMGLDFRTGGKENYPVYAVEDGYISRVFISSNGYGKCLYINHPRRGITSVYAHLNGFSPKIEQWADKTQYAIQQNILDTILPANYIPIVKGEQIALSGNTGSSSGPHLHFELRNMMTEKTLNPLFYYPQILDTKAPSIDGILLYRIQNGVSSFSKPISPKNQEYIVSEQELGIAVSVSDLMNATMNHMGIYQIKLFENGKLKYSLSYDSLDFSWQGHLKSVSDYSISYPEVYKLFYESCGFNLTDQSAPNGILRFSEGERKEIRIEASDYRRNKIQIKFSLKYNSVPTPEKVTRLKVLDCAIENELRFRDMNIVFPPHSLASASPLEYYFLPNTSNLDLITMRLFSEFKPVLKPYQIEYKAAHDMPNKDKIYLHLTIEKKPKTYLGIWDQNVLRFAKVKHFGQFSIRYDIQSPKLTLLSHSKWSLTYMIEDEESGIGNYNLFIDNEWRKIYFDDKSKKLIYKILPSDYGKKRMARLEVEDKVGNKNTITKEIFF